MDFKSFLLQYFITPLYSDDLPYNVYNTLVYAVLLIVAIFLIYKLLKKMNLKINLNFFVATIPYILLASVFRVLRDSTLFKSPIFVSPLIYITVFAIAFSALLFSWAIERVYHYHYDLPMFSIGIILLIYFGRFLKFNNLLVIGQVLGLAFLAIVIINIFSKMAKNLLTNLNQFILGSAMFDASTTVVGLVFYGYGEKHVLPNFFFGIFGPWVMFPLKFIVVLLALWAIDISDSDSDLKNFIKLAILAVTLGPGTRNLLRMVMGV